MNKVQQDSYAIEQAFAKGKAFIGFLTAGDPNLEARPVILRLWLMRAPI